MFFQGPGDGATLVRDLSMICLIQQMRVLNWSRGYCGLVPTSWNAFDPWQFPECKNYPRRIHIRQSALVFMTKVQKASWECRLFAITTRFVQAGKNWARETPPRGCFVQDDGIRGVTGKVPEAWGPKQPRQRKIKTRWHWVGCETTWMEKQLLHPFGVDRF